MRFHKYHALGNDYIVLDPEEFKELTKEQIRRLCHRNYGLGSDGILYGPIETEEAGFALRIFNPDGSEAEKSGNGLRIFARSLWDKGKVSEDEFTILTPGGKVKAKVHTNGQNVTIDMGQVSFDSTKNTCNRNTTRSYQRRNGNRRKENKIFSRHHWQSSLRDITRRDFRGRNPSIRPFNRKGTAFSEQN